MILRSPLRSQRFDGFGQGKLLADKTVNETPAADFSARFQAAIHLQQAAPRRRARLARQKIPEYDSVTIEKLMRPMLNDLFRLDPRRFAPIPPQRPSSYRHHALRSSSATDDPKLVPAPFSFRLRQKQNSQPGYAVSGGESMRHELPQRLFRFDLQKPRATGDVGHEGGAPLFQIASDFPRHLRQPNRLLPRRGCSCGEKFQFFPEQESNRRGSGRHEESPSPRFALRLTLLSRFVVQSQPSPRDQTAETKIFQIGGIVIFDPPR